MRLLSLLACAALLPAAEPFHEAELIFPLDAKHNHASTIVELPNGDLFVCWYRGSGERQADDVMIMAARKKKGTRAWTAPYVLADSPGFPDTNPTMFVDRQERLWLIWQAILANQWETALSRYRVSSQWDKDPPVWQISDPLLLIPRNFAERVKAVAGEVASDWARDAVKRADDKYFSRMGWMTRAHPVQLASGRILAPLYSDGYSFSLMAISDDAGRTWTTSEPIVGDGNIQPTIAQRKDGTLVAYMRDNGAPPKRLQVSESKDEGLTWSAPRDTDIANPGSGSEVIVLRDGTWALINNDLERGRYSLPVWLSDDEGKTWKWKRHLEFDGRGQGAGSFHYPSLIQTRDGMLHASYSYFLNHIPNGEPRKSIKHAAFNVEWVKQGDSAPQ